MMPAKRTDIIAALQTQILQLEGFRFVQGRTLPVGLGPVENAFPHASFPLGAVHEFLPASTEDLSSTVGFISGLLSSLMNNNGTLLWVSDSRKLFPPALKTFGINPDRIIFVDAEKEKHVLWVMEEALKCDALTAVVGEMKDISFTASRRLQLAVEQSKVTGFVIRRNSQKLSTTACVSRWRIASLPSAPVADDVPGVGFPMWRVELLRIRNGKPGAWNIQWSNGKFAFVEAFTSAVDEQKKKTG